MSEENISESEELMHRCREVSVYYYGHHAWDKKSKNPLSGVDDSLLEMIEEGIADSPTYSKDDYKLMLYNSLEVLRDAMEGKWNELEAQRNTIERIKQTSEDLKDSIEEMQNAVGDLG